MTQKTLTGDLLDERAELTLDELCWACSGSQEWIIELVEEGVLEPIDHEQTDWRFEGTCLQRARTATRLQNDLEVNLAGVALALELIDELEILRQRLSRIEAAADT
jgi:chaperone modulatory protein CbpM